ncbi:OLC1v1018735C1 [Oldenlandia corymbosa var. corymbosa]|uniref:Peroxisomal membrane protein PEX14 n=1 Tax=Oldenlandia corymbosa var. corymbosa TaxID=529605 RepID=A0AAV1ECC9_OLDCO|nr:OLC1v1018735C1 [Oldenlandia corymbosa var. corymbosa]
MASPASLATEPKAKEEQMDDAKADSPPSAAEEKSQSSVFVNSEPIREDQVQNAVKFLSHPKVRGSPVMYRRSFLERKGLTKEEIDEAFRRVPDSNPSATTSPPVVPSQDGQLKSSLPIQHQTSTQAVQPAPVASAGGVSKLATLSRFHWSHAFLAVGLLAISGAGSAVLFKKSIIPRLKSWIRKVVLEEEEGESLIKNVNKKPDSAEEAAAAAKAAAAAAADVARASQEMLVAKTEEKRYFSELTSLLDIQIREMKSMSNTLQKLEESNIARGIVPVERADRTPSINNSRQYYGNDKVDNNIRSGTLSPPPSVEPSVAPHPKSYMEIMAMVQRGERPSNIREINDQPPNPNQPVSDPRLAPKPKPWEIGQSQSSTTNGFQYFEENSNGVYSASQTSQSNVDGSVPWWQQKNARITEIETEDKSKAESAILTERPVQRSWVPPQPPPVAMAEAAAAIRQPKRPLSQREQLTDDQLLNRSSEISDDLQRITKISEAGGVERNGDSPSLQSVSKKKFKLCHDVVFLPGKISLAPPAAMDLDPEDVFRDDEDDPDNEFYLGKDSTKELLVYLVDASPKMFSATCPSEDQKDMSLFQVAISCITQSLKTQIINKSYDEVAICFFNTKEKKNLQDLSGVYVFNVAEREDLDRITARFIKEFESLEVKFSSEIGSKYGIVPGSRDNSLYNALWVAQALLRKGSAKTTDKRILLLTNEDDPFSTIKGVTKLDMMRTTIQRAKVMMEFSHTCVSFCIKLSISNILMVVHCLLQDAQDLGISIELLPLMGKDREFHVNLFYAELLGLEGDELTQFTALAGERFEDMKEQLRKRMFKKRKIRRLTFIIANGISIEVNTYALIRPTNPGTITWLDSVTNIPIKSDRSIICTDTGSLLPDSAQRIQSYKNEDVMLSVDEVSEIKRVSTGHLRLLGFKPLSCLKDYHNLKPSTFIFPSDEEVLGSTCVFVALHRSMLQLNRFALAFYGGSTNPRLVALLAQDEIISSGGQVEPPGMHMIHLPYSDDIRHIEDLHVETDALAPRTTDDQAQKAAALVRRVDLRDFSVCQFSNPALQRHYAVLQALALDEDEMPEVKDETLPDEEGMARPGIVKALEEFKLSVYGENYEETDVASSGKVTEASRKRKATAENASKESEKYDWSELADSGKLKDLTVAELKYYLNANNLPVTGAKAALVSRILNHMGK